MRTAGYAVLVVVLVGVCAGIWMVVGSDHEEAAIVPTPGDSDHAVTGPGPQGADPVSAAEHALAAVFGWQPATDESAGAALERARPWLTGELARDAGKAPATPVRELPEWSAWRRSGDVVIATAQVEGTDTCAAPRCELRAQVRQTVLHRDGSSTPYRQLLLIAEVHSTDHGWRLARYRLA